MIFLILGERINAWFLMQLMELTGVGRNFEWRGSWFSLDKIKWTIWNEVWICIEKSISCSEKVRTCCKCSIKICPCSGIYVCDYLILEQTYKICLGNWYCSLLNGMSIMSYVLAGLHSLTAICMVYMPKQSIWEDANTLKRWF